MLPEKQNCPVSRTNTRHGYSYIMHVYKNRCFMLCKITHIIDMHKQCSVTRSDLSASWGQLLNTVCSLEAFRERFAVKARNNRRILLQNARNHWGTIFVDEGPHHSSRPIDDHHRRPPSPPPSTSPSPTPSPPPSSIKNRAPLRLPFAVA